MAESESFNRTFMELKYMKITDYLKPMSSFNRTFMELKFRIIFADRIEEP